MRQAPPGRAWRGTIGARKGRVLALNPKEMKYAWATCGSVNRSLASGIFRVSRDHRFHSHCAGGGIDITGTAFRQGQRIKRIEI